MKTELVRILKASEHIEICSSDRVFETLEQACFCSVFSLFRYGFKNLLQTFAVLGINRPKES